MRVSAGTLAALVALLVPSAASAAWPATQWQVTVTAATGMRLEAPVAVLDASGNLLVAATEPNGARACLFTAKLSGANGAVLWRRSLCDLDSEARSIAVDSAGDVVVGGTTFSGSQSSARIVKYDGNDGRMHWERLYDLGATGAGEIAADIAIDAQRDVYVVASSLAGARLVKYSFGGTLRWESAEMPLMTRVRLDSSGAPFTIGRMRLADQSFASAVTRYQPQDGRIAWQRVSELSGSTPHAIAIGASGDVVVTGSIPTTRAMRTTKFSGADGIVHWQRDLTTTATDAGFAVAIDGRGDAIVTGTAGGAHETVKYRSDDGIVLWRNTRVPRDGKTAVGIAVLFDPAGNAIVAGHEGSPTGNAPDTTIRTSALAGATGSDLWSIAFDGPAGSTDLAGSLAIASDGVFMVGEMLQRGELVIFKYGFAAVPAINAQGLWWRSPAGSESGWGVNLVHQGDILFATWFTYDAERRPLWLVVTEGARRTINSYSGTVYQASGPPFDSTVWDASRVELRPVGTATFTFNDANNGVMQYVENGAALIHPITRQVFATPAPTCTPGDAPSATNFQDLWWRAPAGSENGWGINVTHQGDVIFLTWFTYDAGGAPLWFSASGMTKTAEGTYTGDLYRTNGPGYRTQPWDPNQVTRTRVGTATLAFTAADAGTFSYTVDGVSGSKPITRQVFAAPPTTCR